MLGPVTTHTLGVDVLTVGTDWEACSATSEECVSENADTEYEQKMTSISDHTECNMNSYSEHHEYQLLTSGAFN